MPIILQLGTSAFYLATWHFTRQSKNDACTVTQKNPQQNKKKIPVKDDGVGQTVVVNMYFPE